MSRLSVKYTIAGAFLLLALACGLRHPSVNDPLPGDQLDRVLQQAFQSADAATGDAVRKITEETRQHEIAAAFLDIKALASQPNLTKDQRIAAIRAANTIGQQLQEAGQNGDQQAAETLHGYKASH
jgi:hypothetical protein